MNGTVDVDRTLQQWIEEGPSELPDRVLDEIAVQLDDTPQRRPSRRPWITTGSDTMNRLLIPVAGLAAALVVAVGAYAALNGAPSLGGPSEPDEVVFVSERYGYQLLLPDDTWQVIEIPGTWTSGRAFGTIEPDNRGADRIVKDMVLDDTFNLHINSQEVPDGTTLEEWLEANREALVRTFPGCLFIDAEPASLGGVPASYERFTCSSVGVRGAEVLALHEGRAYAFKVTGSSNIEWDARDMFEEWLPRFSFTD
jgi:hypothetical protein